MIARRSRECDGCDAPAKLRGETMIAKGQMGSALMGSMQNSQIIFTMGTPVNQFVSYQKCQGAPFSPICQNVLLLQRPH